MIDKNALRGELDRLLDCQRAEFREFGKGSSIDEIVAKNYAWQQYVRSIAAPPVRRNLSFSRRTALKTLGASALLAPFLGTLKGGSKARAQAVKRDNLLLIDWPCGMEPGWTPMGTGKDYMLVDKGPGQMPPGQEPQLKTLVDTHRDKILVMSGWEGMVATDLYSHSQGPCSMWTNWTGAPATKGLSAVASIDEVLGAKFKEEENLPFAVIHSGVLSLHRETGASNIAVPYFHWAGPQQPAQAEDDPGKVFMDISGSLATAAPAGAPTGGGATMTPPEMQDALRNKKKSVIDYVMGELASAKNKIAKEDATRLEAHLTAVRSLEQRLLGSAAASTSEGGAVAPVMCGTAMPPDGALTGMAATKMPANAAKVAIAQAEIIALAFRCGITRVATLQLGESDCMFTIPYEGSTSPMHLASHNMGDNNDAVTRWTATRWMMDRVSDILTVFAKTDMGDGTTLLDHTLIVATSEMSIQEHLDKNMPYFVAGGSHGTFKFKKGEHVAFPPTYRNSKMNYTILDYYGLPMEFNDPSAAGGDNKGSLKSEVAAG